MDIIIVQVIISVSIDTHGLKLGLKAKERDAQSRFLIQASIRLRSRVSTISVGDGSDRPNTCSPGQLVSKNRKFYADLLEQKIWNTRLW